MEFDNDRALLLIELYRHQRSLWDPNHPLYYSKARKAQAWAAVSSRVGVSVADVRRKMESLLGSFRRERSRTRRGGAPAAGAQDRQSYTSSWFAYDKMKFLINRDNPKQPKRRRMDSTQEDQLETAEAKDEAEEVEDDAELEEPFLEGLHSTFGDSLMEEQALEEEEGARVDTAEAKPSAFVLPRAAAASRSASIAPAEELLAPAAVDGYYSPLGNDEASVFGQHVANKLRKYSQHTQAIVEHLISNVLFEADMGKHDRVVVSQRSATTMPSNSRVVPPLVLSYRPPATSRPPEHRGHPARQAEASEEEAEEEDDDDEEDEECRVKIESEIDLDEDDANANDV